MKPETRLYVGLFGVQTAMMVGVMIIPFFVKEHLVGGDDRAVVNAYGVQMVGLAAVCLLSAPFLNRVKNSVLCAFIGFVLFGVPYTLCIFCRTPLQYYIAGAVSMAGLAIAWPAMLAWLGGQPDEKLRTRNLAYFNTIVGVGLFVGGVIAGPLYDWDYRLAFAAVGILSAIGIVFIRTLPREKDYFGAAEIHQDKDQAVDVESEPWRANEAFMYCIWLASFAAWGLVSATRTLYPAHLTNLLKEGSLMLFSQEWPLGKATLYTWIQAGLSLTFALTAFAMGRTTKWERKFWLIATTQVVTAVAIFLLSGTRSVLLILACHLVFGADTAFCNLSSQFYSVANPKRKQMRSAINQGLASLSDWLVPLAVVQLAMHSSPIAPFRFMPSVMIAVIGAEALLLMYGKSRFLGSRRVAEPQTPVEV